jgi:hypothetical protein
MLSGWSAGWHTVDSRALKSSSSWLDGMTSASSSSVMVETLTSREADATRSRNRASAAAAAILSVGHPRLFSRLGE